MTKAVKEWKFFDGNKLIEERSTTIEVNRIREKLAARAKKAGYANPRVEIKNLLTQRTEYFDL